MAVASRALSLMERIVEESGCSMADCDVGNDRSELVVEMRHSTRKIIPSN